MRLGPRRGVAADDDLRRRPGFMAASSGSVSQPGLLVTMPQCGRARQRIDQRLHARRRAGVSADVRGIQFQVLGAQLGEGIVLRVRPKPTPSSPRAPLETCGRTASECGSQRAPWRRSSAFSAAPCPAAVSA
jgi:hypothetical protein